MDRLTKVAYQHYHPPVKRTDDWKLYYGDNKAAFYGPATYIHCAAERKRLLNAGMGYKAQFFKIK